MHLLRLLLIGVLVGACTESAAPIYQPPPATDAPAVDIVGSWTLVAAVLDGAPITAAPGFPITIDFTSSSAGGSAGCNGYTTRTTLSGAALQLSNFVVTEVACDNDDAGVAEDRFLAALDRATQVGLDGGLLVLTGQGAELRFRAAEVTAAE